MCIYCSISIFCIEKLIEYRVSLNTYPLNHIRMEKTIFCEQCTTDSQCNTCYLTQWVLLCKQFDLCSVCGMPNHLDHLSDEIHTQFTYTNTPCEKCKPRQAIFLQSRGYCTICFQKVELGVCYACNCLCESDNDMCNPYTCKCICNTCSANRMAYKRAQCKKLKIV